MRNLGRSVKLSRPNEIFDENMNFFEQETDYNSRQNLLTNQDLADIIVKKISFEKEKTKNSPRFSVASSISSSKIFSPLKKVENVDIYFLDDLPKILSFSKKEERENLIDSYDNLIEIPNERESILNKRKDLSLHEIFVEKELSFQDSPIKFNEEEEVRKIPQNEIRKLPDPVTNIDQEPKIHDQGCKNEFLFIKVVRIAVLTLLISILLLLFFC